MSVTANMSFREFQRPKIYIPEHINHLYPDLTPQTPLSTGLDLVTPTELVFTKTAPFQLIDFQIVVKAPKDHHCILIPRSGTYKKWGIIQANGKGLIDEDYCGRDDTIKMPALWIPQDYFNDTLHLDCLVIPAGTRIAQIYFEKKVAVRFERFIPGEDSRGGIGSTGDGVMPIKVTV